MRLFFEAVFFNLFLWFACAVCVRDLSLYYQINQAGRGYHAKDMTQQKIQLENHLDDSFNFLAITDENGWVSIVVEGCKAMIGEGAKLAWAIDSAVDATRGMDAITFKSLINKFVISN